MRHDSQVRTAQQATAMPIRKYRPFAGLDGYDLSARTWPSANRSKTTLSSWHD